MKLKTRWLPVVALAAASADVGAQAHDPVFFDPIDWPSNPPEDCPFEPSAEYGGIVFTGRSRAYTNADCWNLSWASDDAMYSPFSDGTVERPRPDGGTDVVRTLGSRPVIQEQWGLEDADVGYGKVTGDDPMNLTVIGLGAMPVRTRPYNDRYPSGSLVYDGVWYHGSHPEGEGGLGPFVGFRISTDYGRTWSDEPNDPTKPLFGEPALDENGEPNWMPIRIGEPFFVDFGRNMEHSPDGKAYLIAHGATERHGRPPIQTSGWGLGDEAYLLRVRPSPETMNDPEAYEFYGGRDANGDPVWTRELDRMKPLFEWRGRVGPATITYAAPLGKYLCCVTDGSEIHGEYDTYLLEADDLTGPWRLVVYMESFGKQAYFVNIPSRFIASDGEKAWLCYSANFSLETKDPAEPVANPPGSRYGMVLQEFRLKRR